MTIHELVGELLAKAHAARDCARWSCASARHEAYIEDAEEQSRRSGEHANRARCLFEACRVLDPDCRETRDALLAASEASRSFLESRVVVAVKGARAGRVKKVRTA